MANGLRIRELLFMERDGKLSSEQQQDIATLRQAGRFPDALQGPPSPPERGRMLYGGPAATPGPGSGFVSEREFQEAGPKMLAGSARMAPGMIPNPLISAPASAAGEFVAQKIEGRPETDWTQVGVAGAVPLAVAGGQALVRGVGRTATRMLPGRFRAAHETAQTAAREMSEGLRPEVNPGQLFGAARAAGAEAIPATKTMAMLDDLGRTLPAKPVSPGLKLVREHMDNVAGAIRDGAMSLEDLGKLRADLGASIGRAKEVKGLYKGLIGDLESAAQAGGPAAGMYAEALKAFKRDLGVAKFQDLVEAATSRRAIAGADVPVLNVSRLADRFAKEGKEFTELLGPEGMQAVGGFITRFRSLPPEIAYNGWNMMLSGLFAVGGFASGGVTTAVGAALSQELIRNAAAAARGGSKEINQYLTTLVQAARAASLAKGTDAAP